MRLKCKRITCTVLTPMFTFGGIPNQPEIRSQSLKGVMRFWDRAIKSEASIPKLFANQSLVWGAAANEPTEQGRGPGFGKSKVSIQVIETGVEWEDCFPPGNDQVLKYLAFGPIMGNHGYYHIKVGSTFQVVLRSQDEALIEHAIQCIAIAGKIGGLGQRARNGWGRFAVEGYPVNVDQLVEQGKTSGLLSYTSFSSKSELIPLKKVGNWQTVLEEFGTKWKKHIEGGRIENVQFLVAPIQIKNGPRSILSRHPKSLFLILEPTGSSHRFTGKLLYLPYQYLDQAESTYSHEEVIKNVGELRKKFRNPHSRYIAEYKNALKNYR